MLKSKTRWKVRTSNQEKIQILVNELKITPLVASILVNRGFDTVDSARYFLFGKDEFHDPFLFRGMERAVERIKEAIKTQEPILIFGDYDGGATRS